MRIKNVILLAIFSAIALLPVAIAQTLTGSIGGTVVDQGGATIPAAAVTVTNDVSKVARTFTTGQNGTFLFPDLNSGSYSIRISKEGFKALDQRGITLATGETLGLHELKLQI